MNTTQKQISVTIILASEGKYLTQASSDINIFDRVITNQPIYLAATDSPDNWVEISEDKAEEYREELRLESERIEKERKEQMKSEL